MNRPIFIEQRARFGQTVPATAGSCHCDDNQVKEGTIVMKKILKVAVALTAMAATPAVAAPGTSQTYNFTGTVAALCSISGAAATVNFGNLTDANGVYSNPGAKDATDTGAYCNQSNTQATITHTNLVNSITPASGFTNIVPMSASLTTDQTTLADATAATGSGTSTGSTATIGGFSSFKVTATPGTPSTKLEAGTYNASITVVLTPAS